MGVNRAGGRVRGALAVVGVRALRAADDRVLLARFVDGGDEAAFRVIAERHGPMVLAACRRVLSCPHDADDALQAAFPVFARKAAGIRSTAYLGGWLHGTAVRVATTLRRERHRRRARERAAVPPPADHPPDELSWAEVKGGLDEELARLPAAHREVLVLCCLEGHTRDEAAERLGVPVGVVKGRLERARKALADRLANRGLTLSAALFAVAVSPEASAAAVRVSSLASGGSALSPAVHALADRVIQGVAMSQFKLTATGLLAAVALAAASLGMSQPTAARTPDRNPPPVREPIKAPVPKAKDGGRIWLHDLKAEQLIGYAADGTEADRVKLPKEERFEGVTPDGANILYAAMAPGAGKATYHLRPFGADTPGTDLTVDVSTLNEVVCWSRDGTRFIHVRHDNPLRPAVGVQFPILGYAVVDTVAKTATPIKAPEHTYVLGWTADEKQFVGDTIPMSKEAARGVCVFADGEPPTYPTWNETVKPFGVCPTGDGKTLLAGGWKLKDDKPHHAVYRFDPTGTVTELFHAAGQNMTQAVASPDGKRFAAVWIDSGTPGDATA
jgi:RNA polymerase sigma factor (sigma-70 family)